MPATTSSGHVKPVTGEATDCAPPLRYDRPGGGVSGEPRDEPDLPGEGDEPPGGAIGGEPRQVGKDLGQKDSGPSQPILPQYPKTKFGKQLRSLTLTL